MTRFQNSRTTPTLVVGIGVSALVVFFADLLLPLGVAAWIFYLGPLALCMYVWRPNVPLWIALGATVLIVVRYFLSSPTNEVAAHITRINRVLGMAILWAVALGARRFIVAKLKLSEHDWLRSGQRELSARLQGEQSLGQLGDNVLRFLCEYLELPVAALYVVEQGTRLRCCASYALGHRQQELRAVVEPGETLLGQALKDKRIIRFNDLPHDYLAIASALGNTKPAHVVIVPALVDGEVLAVIELGFLHRVGISDVDLLETTAEAIAIAVRSAEYRTRRAELLEETQRQAQELQVQQEELRVSNEELEVQSRALKESQVRLEAERAELERSNAQLAAQTTILELQRDELARAQGELVEKADALERANRYKSEFLANMSHELRTPLNSGLILAKLLADNPEGNLTPEQVKFASTIYSSGNDLLTLINDILDLSRIEAGRVDIHPEEVSVATILTSLQRMFQPLAEKKQLRLDLTAEADAPGSITTDSLRIQQILRNLLSNALKFTDAGEVRLRVERVAENHVAFTVTDTGIGIPSDQHEAIFEAFHQADGSTNRRYGGTGLGLTISSELARRMGGTLTVRSEVGQGSVFTLTVPLAIDAATQPESSRTFRHGVPNEARLRAPGAATTGAQSGAVGRVVGVPAPEAECGGSAESPKLADDRHDLTSRDRAILVVEDDERFASILCDLAHELQFRCLIATTAAEGIQLAESLAPSAILLDVHLPDLSGLGLLEQLKRNPATRHIPVHVVSVADYTQQALEMGAIGYALKPVKREQVVSAIQRIEEKLSQTVRRILVVEDVEAQRESIEALLRSDGVEISSVGRGEEALERLQSTTFDCMVLDLVLPDMSGYDLLEKMAAGEAFSFPPVIVYTGRALTRDEEMRLRRYASSVIIKGARSPERLLDEVSLFLHHVEAKLPPDQQRILRLARQRESAFEGRNILVVEDDARNIFALSSILEPKGAKLLIARNGREALDTLERFAASGDETVDLVLMDIMMPVMDGITATREIRRQTAWRKLPIIALTAKAMADDRKKCIDAGASDYITKPLDVDKLVSLVKVWLPK